MTPQEARLRELLREAMTHYADHQSWCPSCGSDDPMKGNPELNNCCPDPFHNPQEENDAD